MAKLDTAKLTALTSIMASLLPMMGCKFASQQEEPAPVPYYLQDDVSYWVDDPPTFKRELERRQRETDQ